MIVIENSEDWERWRKSVRHDNCSKLTQIAKIDLAFGCVFQVSRMSEKAYEGEEHFDQYDHYNYDQEKAMMSGNSGEWGP